MIAISLGWGVQSTTLTVMSALGDLPPVDVAIHADTRHESKLTYEYAARWTPWLEEHGIKVVVVGTHAEMSIVDKYGGCQLPAYTGFEGMEEYSVLDNQGVEIKKNLRFIKKDGRIRRQCTHEWKIKPIRQWLQSNRNGKPVEQWIGISLDEFQRMKSSNVKYITHRWPLIEKRMTRQDCVKYLEAHNIEVPPRSACTFCPFHNTAEWRRIKAVPEDWKEAVETDELIRKARPPYDLFVHPSRKPLDTIDFRTEQERGQLSLWDNECSGLCGV